MRITPSNRARLHTMLDALLDECDSGVAHGETVIMIRETSIPGAPGEQPTPSLTIRGIVGRAAKVVPDLVHQLLAHSRSGDE